jgi:hypothetical protein
MTRWSVAALGNIRPGGGRISSLMVAAIHSRKSTAEQPSVIRQALAIGALVVLHGCGAAPTLPDAPPELTSGISVYEHAGYAGLSAHITENVTDLGEVHGGCKEETTTGGIDGTVDSTIHVWDDCISSIRVSPGWRAVLYRDDDFDGDELQITEDTPDLKLSQGDCDKGGFNDCVTSIRLIRP